MTITTFLYNVNSVILNPIITLGFALAFAYFFYSVVRFLRLGADSTDRDEARNAILWSIVGLVIMFSVYGLIKFTLDTFGIAPSDVPTARSFLNL